MFIFSFFHFFLFAQSICTDTACRKEQKKSKKKRNCLCSNNCGSFYRLTGRPAGSQSFRKSSSSYSLSLFAWWPLLKRMRIRIQLQRYLIFDPLLQLILTAHYNKLCVKCVCMFAFLKLPQLLCIFNRIYLKWIAILQTVFFILRGRRRKPWQGHKTIKCWISAVCILLVVSDFQWFNYIFQSNN